MSNGSQQQTGPHVAAIVVAVTYYLVCNIVGTVFYATPSLLPSVQKKVPTAEHNWDLASVIIGWVIPPLAIVNISSPLSYAVHKNRDDLRLPSI
jgi:hypothetical protein